jgi:hypothetical protein
MKILKLHINKEINKHIWAIDLYIKIASVFYTSEFFNDNIIKLHINIWGFLRDKINEIL